MAEIRTRRILREKADCKQSHSFGSYVFCSIPLTRYELLINRRLKPNSVSFFVERKIPEGRFFEVQVITIAMY